MLAWLLIAALSISLLKYKLLLKPDPMKALLLIAGLSLIEDRLLGKLVPSRRLFVLIDDLPVLEDGLMVAVVEDPIDHVLGIGYG